MRVRAIISAILTIIPFTLLTLLYTNIGTTTAYAREYEHPSLDLNHTTAALTATLSLPPTGSHMAGVNHAPIDPQLWQVTTRGRGTVTLSPNQLAYAFGQELTLSAVAEPGWQFYGWDGDLSTKANPLTLTMGEDNNIIAIFVPQKYALTTTAPERPLTPPSSSGRHTPVPTASLNPAPTIDVWYGTNQSFGHLGSAQRWVNILGNVAGTPYTPTGIVFSLEVADGNYPGSGRPGWSASGDINGDNQIDIVAGGGSAIQWYEAPNWTRHAIETPTTTGGNGGLVVDVDGDGHLDVVSALFNAQLVWWKNPAPGDVTATWTRYTIDATSPQDFNHDLAYGDIDGDGNGEVVALYIHDEEPASGTVMWYDVPADPTAGPWPATQITTIDTLGFVGLALGDLDGDTDIDVVAANKWFERPANPATPNWTGRTVFSDVVQNVTVYDINGDNRLDIIGAEGFVYPDGEVLWAEAPADPTTQPWTIHLVGSNLDGPENIWAGDLDGDGDADIATGEMGTSTGWNDNDSTLIIYEGLNTSGTSWNTITAATGVGVSARINPVDIDNDGDIDFTADGNSEKHVYLWLNGNATPSITSLEYALNGGPSIPLAIGSDTRRLARPGDFNIDIDRNNLIDGVNQVVITATDSLQTTGSEIVTITYDSSSVWPLPYAINWNAVTNIQDVAQIVDGKWSLTPGGVRIAEVDYDRVLAIGDVIWADFEVTVPITVHAIDPDGYQYPSISPGFGVTLRWNGHTDTPVVCNPQPHCGWLPSGAGSWYDIGNDGPLYLDGSTDPAVSINVGDTVYWKMRVETIPNIGPLYSVKVWSGNQSEPLAWNLTRQRNFTDLSGGSMIFIAHHVDATLGNVDITPLSSTTPTLTVNINGDGNVLVNPDLPEYTYGQVVTLTAVPNTGFLFNGWTGDLSGSSNPSIISMTGDKTITANFISGTPTIVSDDFNMCGLDATKWTFIDPMQDATFTMDGRRAILSLPAETTHDVWGNNSIDFSNTLPRLMQSVPDEDFEVEVKFETTFNQTYQTQGIIVEQDDNDLLRLEFYYSNGNVYLFAAAFTEGAAAVVHNVVVPTISPLYMRVYRQGDTWTQSYSTDGINWTAMPSFTKALTVTAVGVYAGNSTAANTVAIDYIFDTRAPIAPEDPLFPQPTLTLNTIGTGSVANEPASATYACGDEITLTATPGYSWAFDSWEGDLSGDNSPETIVMTGDKVITATFNEVIDPTLTITVAGSGAVTRDPDLSFYTYNDAVMLTATADPDWVFTGWSGDLSSINNPITITMDNHKVVTANFVDPIVLADDFNMCDLDTNRWTYIDPDGDTTFLMDGTRAVFSLPANTTHDIWGSNTTNFNNNVPRIMQPVENVDFEMEVKFETTFSQTYQMQGILVEADDNDVMRIEFLYGNGNTSAFVATVVEGAASMVYNTTLPNNSNPLYMRLQRQGDTWTQSYSSDGTAWTALPSFTHAIGVTAVGVYAGNTNAANTVAVDYIFDTLTPIAAAQEDSITLQPTFALNTIGSGTTAKTPDQPLYACGDQVTLTADPAYGWAFTGWSGDLSGTDSPITVSMTSDKVITATYVEVIDPTLDLTVVGSGAVLLSPDLPTYTYGQVVTLTANPDPGHVFTGWSGDLSGKANPITIAMTSDKVITATFVDPVLTSDDFNMCGLDANNWTYIDPLGDTTFSMNGEQAIISLPGTSTHDVWGSGPASFSNTTARITQPISNSDFEMEVKFETALTQGYQMQGILVEADDNDLIRFEFLRSSNGLTAFAATFINGAATMRYNTPITNNNPLYMRVQRQGDTWTQSYSTDGTTWTALSSFTHALTVSAVSVHAGNGSGAANTVAIDYVFATVNPITPEDTAVLQPTLTLNTIGSGTVTPDPNQPTYACGDLITLEVDPIYGWAFTGWSGDLSGTTAPASVTMTSDKVITATFVEVIDPTLTLNVVGNGAVNITPDLPTYTYSQVVTLTVTPDPGWLFNGWSGDLSGKANPVTIAMTSDKTITATFVDPVLQSDDFNMCSLDTNRWTYINPLGDASLSLDGERAILSLPAGTIHDTWGTGPVNFSNTTARLMQSINNKDFEMEVKFDTDLTQGDQMQGIVVEADDNDLIRFEFLRTSSSTTAFVATFSNGAANIRYNTAIPNNNPLYMRLLRQGDTWTQSYSTDGINWTALPSFTHALAVTAVGVYAGNSGAANTVAVDYVFATVNPIVPEDAAVLQPTLTLNSVGSGTATKTPDQPTYACGDPVMLTAVPDSGWAFTGWSGDLSGTTSPVTVTMTGDQSITANFVEVIDPTLTLNVIGSGAVSLDPDLPTYTYGQLVTLTVTPDPDHIFTGWSGDLSGTASPVTIAMNSDKVITATFVNPVVQSDDFNVCSLDSNRWSYIDPNGDTTFTMDGQRAILSLPVNTVHDTWGNNASDFSSTVPRLMQSINNTDFEVEVKFETNLTQNAQMQGIIVEQDNNDLIRFEFLHTNGSTNAFVATFNNGTAAVQYYTAAVTNNPLYMRVRRQGNTWTQSYSTDGVNWMALPSFTHAMTVTAVGVYAGNSNAANTVAIDYVFATVNPITPEDTAVWQPTLTLNTVGSGTVTPTPDQATHTCGDEVNLTAAPSSGWTFTGWSGDLSGTASPATIIMTSSKVITATFVEVIDPTLTVNIDGSGAVMVTPDLPTYTYGQIVTLTATPDPDWTFTGWSGSLSGTASPITLTMTSDKVVTAAFVNPIVQSDDFNMCSLDTGHWTYIDPVGDVTFTMDGQRAIFDLPADSTHDVWGTGPGNFSNTLPRIVQAIDNTDFEIEVKFETNLTAGYQMQGILIEQDNNDLIRIEFLRTNTSLNAFVATFNNGAATMRYNTPIANSNPLYMRVLRQGNTWTQSYSADGTNWTSLPSFNHTLSATAVGIHAGNGAAANTVAVDYVFDTQVPIDAEDANTISCLDGSASAAPALSETETAVQDSTTVDVARPTLVIPRYEETLLPPTAEEE